MNSPCHQECFPIASDDGLMGSIKNALCPPSYCTRTNARSSLPTFQSTRPEVRVSLLGRPRLVKKCTAQGMLMPSPVPGSEKPGQPSEPSGVIEIEDFLVKLIRS